MSRGARLSPAQQSYLLRTVRIGLWATAFTIALLAVAPLLPGRGDVNLTVWYLLVAAATAGGVMVALVPWRRLLDGHPAAAFWCFYGWSAADVGLISMLIAIDGGYRSPAFFLYALTTVFLAASYPARGQALLVVLTMAAYLAALLHRGEAVPVGIVVVQLGSVPILAFLGSFLSRELRTAQREAERRANLLSIVARSGRGLSTLDPDEVMRKVVECAVDLGLEGAALCRIDEAAGTYSVLHAVGLPEEFSAAVQPLTVGLPHLVREERGTVVLDEYSSQPNPSPLLVAEGFLATIGTPVWSQGEMAAVLGAGSRTRRAISRDQVEAFELLAAQAGTALDNARRFEAERMARERLTELDRLKSDFVSTVSHELRTPLTVIEGMSRTLETRWTALSEDMKHEFVGRISANASVLDDIIARLLDFSRLEHGHFEVRPQPVALALAVGSTIDRIRDLLVGHSIEMAIPPELKVIADSALLDRVVENLVNNAVTHTPPGTRVRLSAEVRPGEDRAMITVVDDGPGIDPQDLPHLGERFFRGGHPHLRPTRGTGLGLALVKQVVELHGGCLEIESTTGEGSCFRFSLPVAGSAAAQIAEERPHILHQ